MIFVKQECSSHQTPETSDIALRFLSKLNMYNWAEICSELKKLEKRVNDKMERLISGNPDPFPFDRLQKGREILTLSRALKMFIEQDQENDAAIVLKILQDKGVKLKSVR